MKTERQKAKKN